MIVITNNEEFMKLDALDLSESGLTASEKIDFGFKIKKITNENK